MSYIEPVYQGASFTCPHCEVVTGQGWDGPHGLSRSDVYAISSCHSTTCLRKGLWVGKARVTPGIGRDYDLLLVWPLVRKGPKPNTDLSDEIQKDYQEAREVIGSSPRAAAALLRLALQKLMIQLGQPGKRINDDIAALVAAGLKPTVQKAADIVRVTGNDGVHPGQIDTDDEQTVMRLFGLINIIAEDQITQPAEIEALYQELPQDKRDGIENRDDGP